MGIHSMSPGETHDLVTNTASLFLNKNYTFKYECNYEIDIIKFKIIISTKENGNPEIILRMKSYPASSTLTLAPRGN